MANKKEFEKPTVKEIPKFTKQQIVGSKKYERFKDFLNGNLEDDKMYSMQDIDSMLEKVY